MDKFVTRSSSTESLSKRPRDDDEHWEIPKRPALRVNSSNPRSHNISLGNRFKGLASEEASGSNSNPNKVRATSINTNTKKSSPVPPIILEIKKEWTHQAIVNSITKYTKTFHLKYRGQGKLAIYCASAEAHQVLKDGLITEKTPFHTFSRKDERTSKIVIRGLPCSEVENVGNELADLGFKNVLVKPLTKSSDQESAFPPLLVQLPMGTDIGKFKQIKYLCNCVIQMEKFKPNRFAGTQCYRCQRFGHTSKNCNLTERCVKCTEQHATKDCPKKNTTNPVQCCNCQGNHAASYHQCNERIKYIQYIESKRNPKPTINKLVKPATNNNNVVDGRSWATVANPEKKKTFVPGIPYVTSEEMISEDKTDRITNEMLHILSVIKQLKDKFSSCVSMMDKVLLILSHLGQYV